MARWNPPLPVYTGPLWKLVYFWEADGQAVMNTLYYTQGPGATTRPTQLEVATAVNTYLDDIWAACLHESTTLNWIRCYSLDQDTAVPIDYQPTLVGTQTGDPMPTYVTYVIRRKAGWAGQHGYGSIQLGCLAEGDCNGNYLAAAANTRFVGLIDALMAPIPTANPTDGDLVPMLANYEVVGSSRIVRGRTLAQTIGRNRLGSQLRRKVKANAA